MNLTYESIQNCRICYSKKLEEILDLDDQPLANSLIKNKDLDPSKYPLRLVFCCECNTVQLGESVNPEKLFSEYVWVTGTSKSALNYSQYFARNALSHSEINKPYVVEVASNDGTFLHPFNEAGCKVLGIDPAKNIAEIAIENGIPTLIEFF